MTVIEGTCTNRIRTEGPKLVETPVGLLVRGPDVPVLDLSQVMTYVVLFRPWDNLYDGVSVRVCGPIDLTFHLPEVPWSGSLFVPF